MIIILDEWQAFGHRREMAISNGFGLKLNYCVYFSFFLGMVFGVGVKKGPITFVWSCNWGSNL